MWHGTTACLRASGRARSPKEHRALGALRRRVFVEEQGVPEGLEVDELDEGALHAVALNGSTVVGTGRLVFDSAIEGRIGRMAVEPAMRRHGTGAEVLAFLEEEARVRGLRRVVVHAQVYVKDFYARHGYREEGDVFMEAGIEHVRMWKELG